MGMMAEDNVATKNFLWLETGRQLHFQPLAHQRSRGQLQPQQNLITWPETITCLTEATVVQDGNKRLEDLGLPRDAFQQPSCLVQKVWSFSEKQQQEECSQACRLPGGKGSSIKLLLSLFLAHVLKLPGSIQKTMKEM